VATIYKTTLVPSKLQLVSGWLVGQPWYRRHGQEPELQPVGGFRLDDPEGEVGIEFLFLRDADSTVYQVPLTYRGAASDEAADGLIATMEHGVLGTRWVYDGAHDPVLVAQLVALMRGDVSAQDQHESDTATRSVSQIWGGADADVAPIRHVSDDVGQTVVALGGAPGDEPTNRLRIVRELVSESVEAPSGTSDAIGIVTAEWSGAGDAPAHGPVALLA
jgi:hypothetical protein